MWAAVYCIAVQQIVTSPFLPHGRSKFRFPVVVGLELVLTGPMGREEALICHFQAESHRVTGSFPYSTSPLVLLLPTLRMPYSRYDSPLESSDDKRVQAVLN